MFFGDRFNKNVTRRDIVVSTVEAIWCLIRMFEKIVGRFKRGDVYIWISVLGRVAEVVADGVRGRIAPEDVDKLFGEIKKIVVSEWRRIAGNVIPLFIWRRYGSKTEGLFLVVHDGVFRDEVLIAEKKIGEPVEIRVVPLKTIKKDLKRIARRMKRFWRQRT